MATKCALVLIFTLCSVLLLAGCHRKWKENHHDQLSSTAASPAGIKVGSLTKLGAGQGVVFSPDLAASGNRRFYKGLGFVYWEGADWRDVQASISNYNQEYPNAKVSRIFLETHGSNGHGLKLQQSSAPAAARSYISLGGLQERLAGTGVEQLVLTACNTGPLFRPEVYRVLKLNVNDHTVLPATRGVINVSQWAGSASSTIIFVRRRDSRIEQTSEGYFREMSPAVRRALGISDDAEPFVVSNLFMQMMLNDKTLRLTSTGYEDKLSSLKEDEPTNEAIFHAFLSFLDQQVMDTQDQNH